MTVSAKIEVHGHPDLKLGVTSGPLDFEFRCDGTLRLGIGPIRARVERVPVYVRIPFLKRHSATIAAAAVGPFNVQVDRFEADVRAVDATARGVVGKNGINADFAGKGACNFDVDVKAELPKKIFGAAIKSALEE
jgi:hypothetical protein